jgi:ABC-type transporter Mla MlaB component
MMHVSAGRPYLIPASKLMAIEVTHDPVSTTISLCGTFDRSERSAFDRVMESAEQASAGIIVDLRRCHNCDSSSIILMLHHKRSLGERLQIVVPEGGPVRRILDVSGLTRRLAVTTTVERARELLLVSL